MSGRKRQIRAAFRAAVLTRDGMRCRLCGDASALDPHHITDRHEFANGGYVASNGITLCSKCHRAAEMAHTGEPLPGFSPGELYRLIGSSREQAEHDDRRGK